MILPNCIGGLGNQLFIATAGYIAGLVYKCPVILQQEKDNAHNIHKHDYRKTALKYLGISMEKQILPASIFWHNDFTSWSPSELSTYSFPVQLNGYYQHIDHILVAEDDIRSRILLGLEGVYQTILPSVSHLNPSTTAFLHIRRGDYVQKSDFHYLQPISYYIEAYKQLCSQSSGPPKTLLIFTDDSSWVKEQKEIMSLPGAQLVENTDELECITIMAKICLGGAICANSTFSWWGAFLGSHSIGSPIFVPERWIQGGNGKLFPPTWTIIPSQE